MSRIVQLFFSAALFPALVRLTHALLAPTLRLLAVDATLLGTVLDMAGQVLSGTTPTYAAMDPYTAAEQQEIVESLAALLGAVPTAFGVVVPATDLGRLARAVADRVLAAA